uniref:DUF4216 domain-containing protein n=1 Tax=Lactuca sativa TaxID=4236 RepID=A0A9R1WNI2_LACSA|nr:hypothetical protein LSAT_V11C100047350 [Lactuca sativa]
MDHVGSGQVHLKYSYGLRHLIQQLMRHNIDVMHVIKNVGENFLGTLLNIEKRTKDTDLVRRDLQDMKIRKNIHFVKKNECWILTPLERKQFCSLVKFVCLPDGYAANLGKNVILEQSKIYELQSHDYHVFMLRILPIVVRGLLDKHIHDTLTELSQFFKILTSATLLVRELETLQEEIVKILCKLESIFPPSFFIVMMHLCIHLPQEAILGGPKQSKTLRFNCRSVDLRLDKRGRYEDETTSDVRDEYLKFLERQHQASLDFNELQQSTFPSWFSSRIGTMYEQNSSTINEDLYALSRGPDNRAISHSGYIVKGVKFLVKSRDDHRRTQNCGVTAVEIHNGVEEDYYGYVDEVLEFSFIKGYRVILFKCIWFDTDRKRMQVMFEPQFISIDTTKKAYDEDHFLLANQAKQVFYINDLMRDSGWKIIERSTHMHLWDIPNNEDVQDMFEHVGTPSDTTPFQASDCENFEFHFVEIVDVEAFEDDLDDFIDYDTIPKEISDELP